MHTICAYFSMEMLTNCINKTCFLQLFGPPFRFMGEFEDLDSNSQKYDWEKIYRMMKAQQEDAENNFRYPPRILNKDHHVR